jgi:hypothetical protein
MTKKLFTKSRFKLALECPTKLYYASNPTIYADQKKDDPFLLALAEGGYQVGELAKYLVSENPITDDISIETLDYDESLEQTAQKRADKTKSVIAEAAFRYKNLFVRTDLFVEEGNCIDIYEVKAKSWDDTTMFLKTKKNKDKTETTNIDTKWAPYLYDIAFQKYVVSASNPDKRVRAHIILADKTSVATINGLNQLFQIEKDSKGRIKINVNAGITTASLGNIPLKIKNVDEVCDWIYSNPVKIDLEGIWMFEPLVEYLSEEFEKGNRVWTSCINKKCKKCQFTTNASSGDLKSGFNECWKKFTNMSDQLLTSPLILELWGGGFGSASIIDKAIGENIYTMHQADNALFVKDGWIEPAGETMDATKRRMVQLEKTKASDYTPYLDIDGLKERFNNLPAPYHFIDFETTMVALPFHENRRPYEGIAFQYSYHLMDASGKIEHKNQYLCFEKGVFPNYDFLRSLRADLSKKGGTIFRFHGHENNFLNLIYNQLKNEKEADVPDKDLLMQFVQEIASPTDDNADEWEPINNMQDLYQLTLNHFYSLHAKGSNSIKDILPSVIKSSEYIRNKYSQSIYGTADMPSLNFSEGHSWISVDKDLNPYKTLPPIFDEAAMEMFDVEGSDLSELNNGGAAMTAYAYLQFTNLSEEKRKLYHDALLRYCELDTLAMAMIWDYWGREINKW